MGHHPMLVKGSDMTTERGEHLPGGHGTEDTWNYHHTSADQICFGGNFISTGSPYEVTHLTRH